MMKAVKKYNRILMMIIKQYSWTTPAGFTSPLSDREEESPQLALIFGSRRALEDSFPLNELKNAFPQAIFAGCSTAGEISGTTVNRESVQITTVRFSTSRLSSAHTILLDPDLSHRCGQELARSLPRQGLVHVLILADGLKANGSELVKGVRESFPSSVSISGGFSADMDSFEKTLVLTPNGFESQAVTAVGFYGEKLRVGCGSAGGWDPFGPIRLITRSRRNILYELDGKSSLDLYKKYLGEHAAGLPATGLLFPLSLRDQPQDGDELVRTVLAVNETDKSMLFAGNMPQGTYARLMKADTDRLIDGASRAAQISLQGLPGKHPPQLAILISCAGRLMVMKQRVEEEVETVKDILGEECCLTGFYSYGEISPLNPGKPCELHNQTMTVTSFQEEN